MRIIRQNSEADRNQWLGDRLDFINSTESAALFGLSPYASKFQLYHDKKAREISDFDNERMRVGRHLEPAIAHLAAEVMGCTVEPFKVYGAHDEHRIGSSFDFRITSGEYAGWLLEIKNVDFIVFRDNWIYDRYAPLASEAPPHIEIQVQHECLVSGAPGCIIAALVAGNDLKLIPRPADAEMQCMIIEEVARFWQDFEAGIEPSPDFEKDADYIIKMKKLANEKPFIATAADPISALLDEDDALKAAANKIDKRRKEIKAECLMIIDDADQIIIDGKKRRSCTFVPGSPDSVITADMVGQTVKGRAGFRNFR